jgi:hypothetical protein
MCPLREHLSIEISTKNFVIMCFQLLFPNIYKNSILYEFNVKTSFFYHHM